LTRRLGTLEDKHVVIVGDLTHSRVFRSNVACLGKLGARVTVVAPPTLMPSGIDDWSARAGFATAYDLDEVLPKADAVMMLRVQRERMSGGFFPTGREYTVGYGLTRDRLAVLGPEVPICHPGPMNRGLEIAADAADAAQSLIREQVSAGVAIRMSILYHLLAGVGPDAPLRHPGPMSRGLEIAADAADAAESLILEQVSAGVAIRMSILYHLLAGEGSQA